MSILDEFVILIKSNAKLTEKDLDELGKKVNQVQDNIDRTDKKTKELGLSFGDLVKAFVSADAITGFFDTVKSFASSSADYENKLWRLSKLTGQNVSAIDAWDQTLKEFGAPAGDFLSFLEQANQEAAKMGIGGPQAFATVISHIKEISAQYKDANVQAREFGFLQAQFPEKIAEDLALIPDSQLQSRLDYWTKNRNLTQANAEEVHKYEVSLQKLDAVWMQLFNDALPLLEKVLKYFDRLVTSSSKYAQNINTGNSGSTGNSGNKGFWSGVGDFLGVHVQPAGTDDNLKESQAFWLAQGYSPAQVAALLGNERAEGGFASNATGDNGTSFGIFQWHDPARRAAILAATGIDVTTASHADQLKAAAWELQHSGYAARLRASSTAGQGAAILTQYENPANASAQALLRGQYADRYLAAMGNISAADNSPINSMQTGGGKNINVNVGDVTIHTQATDAQGISVDFASQLHTHIRNAWASIDDPNIN